MAKHRTSAIGRLSDRATRGAEQTTIGDHLGRSRQFVAEQTRAVPRLMPRFDGRELVAIFAGGVVGSLARAGLAEAFPHADTSWPWATFAVNIVGAAALGYFVTRLQERLPPSRYRRPFLGTGLCGALTTFSTMQVELLRMLDAHCYGLALGYAAGSIAAGFAAVFLATAVTRRTRVTA